MTATPDSTPSPPKTSPLTALPKLLWQGWRFFREHGVKASFKAINSKDAHPLIQFGKYGMCGVAALITQLTFFYLFSNIWPSARETGLADGDRAFNHAMANLAAFPVSNLVAYVLNRLWVFTPGRHSGKKEFALFTIIALISFLAGLLGGPFLIKQYGISHHLAEGGFVLTSALVNFVCRKFFVFAK